MILKKLVPLAMVAFLALPISAIANGTHGHNDRPLVSTTDKSANTQSAETVAPQAGNELCTPAQSATDCALNASYDSAKHLCCLSDATKNPLSASHKNKKIVVKYICGGDHDDPYPCPPSGGPMEADK